MDPAILVHLPLPGPWRFAAAVENADASALAELSAQDVALEMPPALTWFTGRQAVVRFVASNVLTGPGRERLVPAVANGQPAFAVYQREPGGTYHAHAVQVLRVTTKGSRGSSPSWSRVSSPSSAATPHLRAAPGPSTA